MLEESTGNFSASRNVYDWYQTQTHVILNIMIKNLTEGDVKVRLIDETLDVTCTLANSDEYRLHFNLFKPIFVAESSWTVTPSKLEIKLKKTDRKRWQSLEVIPEKGSKRPPSYAGVFPADRSTSEKRAHLDLEGLEAANSLTELNDELPITVGGLKYDWYQTDTLVIVAVLMKNLNENDVKVQFAPDIVQLDCQLPDGQQQKLHLTLSHFINPDESTVKVNERRLEMRLKKVDIVHWDTLESADSPGEVVPESSADAVHDGDESAIEGPDGQEQAQPTQDVTENQTSQNGQSEENSQDQPEQNGSQESHEEPNVQNEFEGVNTTTAAALPLEMA